MRKIFLSLIVLAGIAHDASACGLFRRGRCQSSQGATCTQATTYQPVRGVVRAIVPSGCNGNSCPR